MWKNALKRLAELDADVITRSLNFYGEMLVVHSYRRTPKGYDSTGTTSHRISDLLPDVLAKIGGKYQDRGDLVMAVWPSLIGPQLAPMAQAVAFSNGTLI